jgi:drug/metabolite transporter, DME family
MKKMAPVFILLAGMLWATIGIFIRNLEKLGIHSMEIVAIKAFITLIAMLLFLGIYDRRLLRVRLKDCWCFVGTGICSVVFFNFCYFKTITLTSLSVAAILLYTAPMLVMILSIILFQEKLTKTKLMAIIFAFGGCIFVTGILESTANIGFIGLLTGLGAGFGYALYSIFGRYALKRGYHPLTITAYTFLFASIGSLPAVNLKKITGIMIDDTKMTVYLIVFTLITTILPYFLYTTGLSLMENSTASIIASIEPVVATVIGIIVFREKLSVTGSLGIMMVIAAIVILNRKQKIVKH